MRLFERFRAAIRSLQVAQSLTSRRHFVRVDIPFEMLNFANDHRSEAQIRIKDSESASSSSQFRI